MNQQSCGLTLLLVLALFGCAHRPLNTTATAAKAPDSPAPATLPGELWDLAQRRQLNFNELLASAQTRDFILLGESHDNPEHHQKQAELLRALTALERRPALAWEMISADYQKLLDGFDGPFQALGDAVDWQKRGWPSFEMYAPIAEVALEHGLPQVAANIAGRPSTSPPKQPLPSALLDDLKVSLVESHCGHANSAMIEAMSHAQQHRDAFMATKLAQARAEANGVVLIAGREHARRDRGVPFFLERQGAAPSSILSIALVQAPPKLLQNGNHALLNEVLDGFVAFDVVWFTQPRAEEDHCERFRQQLESMKRKNLPAE